MKIAVTYSSKNGLLQEYRNRFSECREEWQMPEDLLAEGDSVETIRAVIGALTQAGHHVRGVEADDSAMQRLKRIRPDLVFNIAEGLFGAFRESYIPMICERLGLPYTGSDPLTLAICLDKARTKEVLSHYGIRNPAFRRYEPFTQTEVDLSLLPGIIKPVCEGSSKGIYNSSVVRDRESAGCLIQEKLFKYQQPVILEKFLPGAEFTVAVWGNGENIQVLPIVEINYRDLPAQANPIYSYEAKWIWDRPEKPLNIFNCPANISPDLRAGIEHLVLRTCKVLNVRDWCRIDVRCDERDIPHILEVNPLPGILPNPEDNSCFPKAARTAGYGYQAMLEKILKIATLRTGLIHVIDRQQTEYIDRL